MEQNQGYQKLLAEVEKAEKKTNMFSLASFDWEKDVADPMERLMIDKKKNETHGKTSKKKGNQNYQANSRRGHRVSYSKIQRPPLLNQPPPLNQPTPLNQLPQHMYFQGFQPPHYYSSNSSNVSGFRPNPVQAPLMSHFGGQSIGGGIPIRHGDQSWYRPPQSFHQPQYLSMNQSNSCFRGSSSLSCLSSDSGFKRGRGRRQNKNKSQSNSKNGNQMNYYESESEKDAYLSASESLSGVSSASRSTNYLRPVKLAKNLTLYPGFQTTLLILIEKFDYSPKQVKNVIQNHKNVFHLEGEEVFLKPKLSICQSHLGKEGCTKSRCKELHICENYVKGDCFDKECLMGHIWYTVHNKAVLNDYHLVLLSPLELSNLFKVVFFVCRKKEELKVCEDYINGSCSNLESCKDLHLCIKYLAQSCQKGKDCQLSHNIKGKHVSSILLESGISLNESPRDIILLLNSLTLIHDQVKEFNDTYSSNDSQDALSKNGDNPADGNSSAVKTKADVKKKNYVAKPIRTVWSREFKGEVTKAEICYNSVESFCNHEEKGCYRLHSTFHFHWQVKSPAKDFWVNLDTDSVLALEKAYIDSSIDVFKLPPLSTSNLPLSLKGLVLILKGKTQWEVDFEKMNLTTIDKNLTLELRRLCTEDPFKDTHERTEPSTFCWYFLDKNSKWIEYGKTDSTENHKSNITSNDIEKHFRKNPDSALSFQSDAFSYTLDVLNMFQTNLKTLVQRKIKRRPMFHLQEINDDKTVQDLPKTWVQMRADERVKRVTLDANSPEYQQVLTFLNTQNVTGTGINVLKIERVQNPYHYRIFQQKVNEMFTVYNDKTIIDEQQLFHGTGPDVIQAICEQNLDWRLHGSNAGQVHGRGAYFSPLPSTSMAYTRPDSSGHRFMFIARVAVGTIATGANSNTTRPPMNPLYNIPYDSTADRAQNPSIIVKYDKAEYYMEYILTIG